MKANINDKRKIAYPEIPKKWNSWDYYKPKDAYADGWRDVIIPSLSETEKLGRLYFDETEDVFKYQIEEKTEEELAQEINIKRNELKQQYQQSKFEDEIKNFDDEKAVEFKDLYKFWEVGQSIEIDDKRQALDNNNEIKLYKAIQPHTTQEDWQPKDTPALWVEIVPAIEIPVWRQPQGQHDAYMKGDKVWYPEKGDDVWISQVAYNVYAPGIVPGGWEKEK